MSETYFASLINLAADARATTAYPSKIDRRDVGAAELLGLLRNFCEIDAVENATADPEIRVQAGGRSWLVRAGQKKLLLYDAINREAPGDILTPDEVMAELDGSAARTRSPFLWQEPAEMSAPEIPIRVERRLNVRRVIVLSLATAALLAGIFFLRQDAANDEMRDTWSAVPASEVPGLRASLAGVYVTGTDPGEHGIVVTTTAELRLFEFRAIDSPRLIYAAAEPGHMNQQLSLLTDQPGGLITVSDSDTLVYCGETYKRVP